MTIDDLLSQPLPPMPDNGFSARVIARLKAEERRRTAAVAAAAMVAATLLCLLVPMPLLTGEIGDAVLRIATSPPVGLAAALLVLTFLIDRLYSDRHLLRP